MARFALALLTLLAANAFAATSVSNCGWLNTPGETYELTQDIFASGTCFTIAGNDIVFNGNGSTITGSGSGIGVQVYGTSNVIVRNVKVARFSEAIRVNGTTGTIVEETHISYSFNGIYLSPASDGIVRNNYIVGTHFGLRVRNSNGNQIVGNLIEGNSYGMPMWYSSGNIVEGNTIRNSGSYGINIGDAPGNLIYNNIFANYRNVWLSSWSNPANTWSVPAEARENIIGGPYVGGNFWSNPAGTGVGDNCNDLDENGFCDQQVSIGPNNIDFYPLTPYVPNKDSDEDGVPDRDDNCVNTPNPDQLNFDGDDWGDACDWDDDNDGIHDVNDACPFESSYGADGNGDGCVDRFEDFPSVAASYDAPGTSLAAKAASALAAYERGNHTAALNILRALTREMKAQERKTLSHEDVDELTTFIANITANFD